jgi:hypothetical protein
MRARATFIVTASMLALLLAGCVAAPTRNDSLVLNPDLTPSQNASDAPGEWRADGKATTVGFDAFAQYEGKPSYRVSFTAGEPYAGLVQRFRSVDALRGQTLIVTGKLRRSDNKTSIGIWVRAFDKDSKSVAYANSYEQAAGQDSNWETHRITLTIPQEATSVLIGASIYGESGTMWLSSVNAHPNRGKD